jgi:hypothetical protein
MGVWAAALAASNNKTVNVGLNTSGLYRNAFAKSRKVPDAVVFFKHGSLVGGSFQPIVGAGF